MSTWLPEPVHIPAADQLALAWLAGLIDGEGTVGLTLGRTPQVYVAIQMTSAETIDEAARIMRSLGLTGVATGPVVRRRPNPAHSPTTYVRVRRLTDVVILAAALLPFAITKRDQLTAVHAWAEERLIGAKRLGDGRVVSIGNRWRKRPPRRAPVAALAALNRKGPA